MTHLDRAMYLFVRAWVFYRDLYHCQYCNRNRVRLNLHHAIYFDNRPRWQYPAWALKTLCSDCNQLVGNVGSSTAPPERNDCTPEAIRWFWRREAKRILTRSDRRWPRSLDDSAHLVCYLDLGVMAAGPQMPDGRPPHIQAQDTDPQIVPGSEYDETLCKRLGLDYAEYARAYYRDEVPDAP